MIFINILQDMGLKEIVNFFSGLTITQVKLVGNGTAFVQLKNVDMKQEALTYDLRFMSSKFVHGQLPCPPLAIFKVFSSSSPTRRDME